MGRLQCKAAAQSIVLWGSRRPNDSRSISFVPGVSAGILRGVEFRPEFHRSRPFAASGVAIDRLYRRYFDRVHQRWTGPIRSLDARSDITGIGGLMSAEGTPTKLSFRANATTSLIISGLADRDTPATFRFVTRCVGTGGNLSTVHLVIDGEMQASRTCTEGAEFFSVARLVNSDTRIIIGMSITGELARQSFDSSFPWRRWLHGVLGRTFHICET
jgi:hypothetical protein